jgi:hypothetical protein
VSVERVGQWALIIFFVLCTSTVLIGGGLVIGMVVLKELTTVEPDNTLCSDGELIQHGPNNDLPFMCSDGRRVQPPRNR